MADKECKVKKPWGSPIKKQQSVPIRPTPGMISSAQENKPFRPAETKNKCAKSPGSTETKRPHAKTTTETAVKTLLTTGRVPLDADYRELAMPSKKRLWKSMSEDQRQLKTKNFLSVFINDAKIMNDVLTNYRDGKGLRKKLSNLPAVHSMFGDCLSSGETADENVKPSNKETRDIEIQTGGEQIEENDLKNVCTENVRLCADLDSAKKILACLKRELRERTRQLKNESEKTEKLNSQINSLFDAERDKENIEEEMLNELSDTKKEKDKIAEELIELKNEHAELKNKYLNQKSEADAMRAVKFIFPNKLISEKDDEIESKNAKIEYLKNSVAAHREEIENLTKDNRSKEAEVEELKENVDSWETKFDCWLENSIRDRCKPQIEKLVNENNQLKTYRDRLMDEHQRYISETKGRINKLEKLLESRQAVVEEQNKIIEYATDSKSKQQSSSVAADNGWTLSNLFRW